MSQRAALSACTTSTRRLDLRASLAASGVACDRAAMETSMRLGHLIGGAGVNFDGRELDDTHLQQCERGGAGLSSAAGRGRAGLSGGWEALPPLLQLPRPQSAAVTCPPRCRFRPGDRAGAPALLKTRAWGHWQWQGWARRHPPVTPPPTPQPPPSPQRRVAPAAPSRHRQPCWRPSWPCCTRAR
jgi:hypothetical protein